MTEPTWWAALGNEAGREQEDSDDQWDCDSTGIHDAANRIEELEAHDQEQVGLADDDRGKLRELSRHIKRSGICGDSDAAFLRNLADPPSPERMPTTTRTDHEVGAIYEDTYFGGAYVVLGEDETGAVEVEQVVKGRGGRHFQVGSRWTHRTALDHTSRKIGYADRPSPEQTREQDEVEVRLTREEIETLIGVAEMRIEDTDDGIRVTEPQRTRLSAKLRTALEEEGR